MLDPSFRIHHVEGSVLFHLKNHAIGYKLNARVRCHLKVTMRVLRPREIRSEGMHPKAGMDALLQDPPWLPVAFIDDHALSTFFSRPNGGGNTGRPRSYHSYIYFSQPNHLKSTGFYCARSADENLRRAGSAHQGRGSVLSP